MLAKLFQIEFFRSLETDSFPSLGALPEGRDSKANVQLVNATKLSPSIRVGVASIIVLLLALVTVAALAVTAFLPAVLVALLLLAPALLPAILVAISFFATAEIYES